MEKIKLNDRTFKVMIPAEEIDKAVAKGIMHKNTVARKKSQLALKLNKIA